MSQSYIREYQKKNILSIKLNLNRVTESDIIAFLESVPNKQGLIKELLRQEMERTDFRFEAEEPIAE